MKAALGQLGFGPCHHMSEVFASAAELDKWRSVIHTELPDWETVFDGYRSCIDWPSTAYWRELIDFYPDARVILTVRPVEAWLESMQKTICELIANRQTQTDPHYRDVLDFANVVVNEKTFDGHLTDSGALKTAYERRIIDVTATVARDRLLQFDVRDGWEPLCAFLDVPVPDSPFPSGNTAEEFWRVFSS